MTQNDSDLRNNSEKCLYNDRGFCKFRLECRKRHFENVCEIKDCDKKCLNRHPKPCKYKKRCKFNAKSVCAFSHVNDTLEHDKLGSDVLEKMDSIQKHVKENIPNMKKISMNLKGL